ncbi:MULTISPECIES: putative protein N(5)-glutamine methyltransferase [unclassified Nocardioides]|uniref:putative protein N(5)-glutamine methyltransferase n=1 Tax=unclassified Nocardioides TaxID=2615069 RepID=UPI000700A08D|nr:MULTISPECIES: putative protein N(5)-glutamine methyltransferase [unclassified Nocardioides]KRA38965.1 hypothetical protein ASD81_10395 [Nocardioides sp. Root614]KRA92924.1 hypothetical protein ASD84_10660 [Nocardioides sp. Root682]
MPTLVARLRAAGCVFAEEEADLLTEAAGTPAELEELVARRVAGVPLEYVVGWVAFDGLRVAVEPGVFVPRQRTSYLVELAAEALTGIDAATVLDLCCGSGALGLALAHRHPRTALHATDNDPVAVACAARNLEAVGGIAHLGDLDEPLSPALRGRVDVILANVPYVPTAAIALMPPESRDHEPLGTVDGGTDGLDVLRRVAALAPTWLRPGGSVFSEVSEAQAGDAATAFSNAGLDAQVRHDPERDATVLSGKLR